MMYIAVDESSCIGCSSCAAVCPDIFYMTSLDTARSRGEVSPAQMADVKNAMRTCPVKCIFWEEE